MNWIYYGEHYNSEWKSYFIHRRQISIDKKQRNYPACPMIGRVVYLFYTLR